MKLSFSLVFALLFNSVALTQTLTQTIRGRIVDQELNSPLIGANVVLTSSEEFIGASADLDGYFTLKNIPVGRHEIKVTYLGYEEKIIPNILLGAGKEVVLQIKMTESFVSMKTFEVTAEGRKNEVVNDMSLGSVRSFSTEETKRYAGALDDPARMAQAFAGVSGGGDLSNELVIRGNSPRGMLWKMEGVDIPNPNHFGEQGASGGPISMLTNNMLGKSDFLTGAFAAEYGNATSGVFDLSLRQGNNQTREYAFQAGLLGVEFAAEGPFKASYNGSYLVNYRYSSLALMNNIGIEVAGDAVPKYQDLSYHVVLPAKKLGTFKLWGLGGISAIDEGYDDYHSEFIQYTGVSGINHTISAGEKSYLKTTVALSRTRSDFIGYDVDTITQEDIRVSDDISYVDDAIRVNSFLNTKFNSKSTLKTGVQYSRLRYNYFGDTYDYDDEQFYRFLDDKGGSNLYQAYANWKYRITKDLTFLGGMHYTLLELNHNQSLEPRASLQYKLNDISTLTASYGLHSNVENMAVYLAKGISKEDPTNTTTPNRNVDFMKAHHYVLGYQRMLSENLNLKAEVYYQHLFDVPVDASDTTSFTSINYGAGFTNAQFDNDGTGYNYGLELTLEKFFSNNYYFMLTTSVFESKYTGGDGIERNTRYNGNFVANVLAGKEWNIKGNQNKTLGISTRITTAGGQRIIPIDLAESIEQGQTVVDVSRAWEESLSNYFRGDLQVQYRINKKNSTRVWKLDVQNASNTLNAAGQFYNDETQQIETYTGIGLLPVLSYRIEF